LSSTKSITHDHVQGLVCRHYLWLHMAATINWLLTTVNYIFIIWDNIFCTQAIIGETSYSAKIQTELVTDVTLSTYYAYIFDTYYVIILFYNIYDKTLYFIYNIGPTY